MTSQVKDHSLNPHGAHGPSFSDNYISTPTWDFYGQDKQDSFSRKHSPTLIDQILALEYEPAPCPDTFQHWAPPANLHSLINNSLAVLLSQDRPSMLSKLSPSLGGIALGLSMENIGVISQG
jgi:hypothetical protein